ASSIRARSTRLAGSVRDRAIARNAANSSSPIANSIPRRRPAIAFISASESTGKPTGCDADVAQDRAGELGEEALDEVEPGAVHGSGPAAPAWQAPGLRARSRV